MTRLSTCVLLVAAAAALSGQVAEKANSSYRTLEGRKGMVGNLADPHRPDRLKAPELVKNLQITPGMTVADIGSGAGMLLPFLSNAVGPTGRVIAQDIFRDFLDKAREYSQSQKLTNVMFVLGTDREARLPENCCDVIVTVDAYHHYDYPELTLAGIRAGLRPGGHFVIVDYFKRENAMGNGAFALEHIRIDKDAVIKEVESYGFRLASQRDHVPGSQYMLHFTAR